MFCWVFKLRIHTNIEQSTSVVVLCNNLVCYIYHVYILFLSFPVYYAELVIMKNPFSIFSHILDFEGWYFMLKMKMLQF